MKLDDGMLLTLKYEFESRYHDKYQSNYHTLWSVREYVYTQYNAHLKLEGDDWHLNFNNPRDETFFRLTHS